MEARSQSPTPLPRGTFGQWWSEHVVASVAHREVVEKVHGEGGWSGHYLFMTLMSAGIAVLGLLLSSPAVVIGAMLISPLMGPIIGLGFALATFDSLEMRRTASALGLGILVAVLFCAIIVLLSPLQTVTSEIAARTRPNLFDLLVALFSGMAGSYAMIRGRHGTIVGVAIATALMPPLAVVGFGLATLNSTVLLGSALLFFTNLMTIAITAAVLARIYGFAGNLSPNQSGLQAALVIGSMVALAVPLALSLRQIAWETLASRESRTAITGYFGPGARVTQMDVDFQAEPIEIAATVLTPAYKAEAERAAAQRLQAVLGRPVRLTLDQLRTSNGEAEEVQLAAAAKGSLANRGTGRVTERLALVAGVAPDAVLVDSTHRRAQVRAAVLPGADLATYRSLEQRVAAAEQGWAIVLIPPAAPLPSIAFDGDAPTAEGTESLRTAIWAAQRLGVPIGVSASAPARADAIVTALKEQGITAEAVEGEGGDGVTLRWLAPGSAAGA